MARQILTLKLDGITAGDYLTWCRDPEPPALDFALRSISIHADPIGDTITATLDWNQPTPAASTAATAAGLPLSAGIEVDELPTGIEVDELPTGIEVDELPTGIEVDELPTDMPRAACDATEASRRPERGTRAAGRRKGRLEATAPGHGHHYGLPRTTSRRAAAPSTPRAHEQP